MAFNQGMKYCEARKAEQSIFEIADKCILRLIERALARGHIY